MFGLIAPLFLPMAKAPQPKLAESFLYRSVKRQLGSVKRISIPDDKKIDDSDKSGRWPECQAGVGKALEILARSGLARLDGDALQHCDEEGGQPLGVDV